MYSIVKSAIGIREAGLGRQWVLQAVEVCYLYRVVSKSNTGGRDMKKKWALWIPGEELSRSETKVWGGTCWSCSGNSRDARVARVSWVRRKVVGEVRDLVREPDCVEQGCQTHFHQGPHQPHSCLQRAECNFNSLKLRSSYIYTVLKLCSALWRQLWGWCGPQWKWVWHPCFRVYEYSQMK